MKKIILCAVVCVMVAVGLFACGGGGGSSNSGTSGTTYSNATLTGPWLKSGQSYIIADGNGSITEHGQMNAYSPAGTYQLQSNGDVTLNFFAGVYDPEWSASGSFTSATTAVFPTSGGNETITKVSNLAACQGNWSGTITETSGGSTSHPISFTINSNGVVTAATGYTITSGKMFCESGVVRAFFKTTSSLPYNQIQIYGTVSGTSITGSFDCDSNNLRGSVSLTKQ